MSDSIDQLQIGIVADSSKAILELDKLSKKLLGLQKTMTSFGSTKMNVSSQFEKANNSLKKANNSAKELVSTSRKLGTVSNGFSRLFNNMTIGSNKASKSTKSLTSQVTKMIGVFYLARRAFDLVSNSTKYASDLVEVQNVVDNVFGSSKHLIEDFAKTSIQNFGMSQLTAKKTASEFQAMANAMGITNAQVKASNNTWSLADTQINKTKDAYNNAAESVADMSLNLTKLSADMGSFYNKDYEQVAEQLASGVLSGQSRSLRAYGLDLTQATLKEFAISQGLNSNIQSMTQAEKTMLRYQYVMSRTANIQGDLLRTSNSWSNVVRILAQNFQNLGSTIGGITINAFKPLMISLNTAIIKLNDFAIAVSNSLGKIFGWKYEASSGSGGSALGDLAEEAGGLSNNLGSAGDKAKKLKAQLQGFDQLNVLSSNNDSNSGSGGSSGGGASGGASSSNGGWSQTESIFESELDSLDKLGSFISDKLATSLESINWQSIYQGAKDFGKGLADFLNGLITPRLFYDVGENIANTLNTAIYSTLTFAENFDFENFGKSIASSINGFFQNFDFEAAALDLNSWIDGLEDTVTGFLDTFDWKAVIEGAQKFISGLEIDTLTITIGTFAWKMGLGGVAKSTLKALLETKLATGIGKTTLSVGGTLTLAFTVASIGFTIGSWSYENIPAVKNFSDEVGKWIFGENYDKKPLEITFNTITVFATALSLTIGGVSIGSAIAGLITKGVSSISLAGLGTSILTKISGAISYVASGFSFASVGATVAAGLLGSIAAAFVGFEWGKIIGKELDKLFGGDGTIYDEFKWFGEGGFFDSLVYFFTNILPQSVKDSWTKIKNWWGDKKLNISGKFTTTKQNVSKWWTDVKEWWGEKLLDLKNCFKTTASNVSNWWLNVKNWWGDKSLDVKNAFKTSSSNVSQWWSNVKSWWGDKKLDISSTFKTVSSNVSGWWSNVKALWGDKSLDIKSKLTTTADTIKSWWNNIKSWWGTKTLDVNTRTTSGTIRHNADGGAYYQGTWHAIPQYASGGSPSHGTMFVAGEAGAEAVGHINGRTEVLNQSQMASVMYDAVLSGMSAAMARSGSNRVEVVLEGDAQGIFNVVRKQDRQFKNVNGHSAFGY